jgi:hypothetical protein
MTDQQPIALQNNRPQDIRPAWYNIVRRMQSVARNHEGIAIVQMTVLVNADGNPILWREPDFIKFEPRHADAFKKLMQDEVLLPDDLMNILKFMVK